MIPTYGLVIHHGNEETEDDNHGDRWVIPTSDLVIHHGYDDTEDDNHDIKNDSD